MNLALSENFCELSNNEMIETEGGMAPAIVYALGFVMGVSPAGALAVCGAAVAVGVVAAVASTK